MHSSPGRNTHPSPDKLAENVLTPHRICNHNDADEAANKNSATVFSSHSSSLKQFSSSEASSPQSPPPFPSSISSSHVCNSESGHTNQLPPIPTSIAGPKRKSIKKRIRNMFTKRSSSPLHGNNSSHHAGNEQINIKNLSKNSNNSNPNHPNHNNRNAKDPMAKNNSTRTRTRSRIYNKRKHKTMKRHPNIASVSDLKSLGTIDLNHDDDQIEESQSSIISIFDDLDVFHTTRCSSYTSLEIDSLKELSASSDALSCSGISSGSTLLPDTSVSSNASNSTIIDPAFNRRRCTSAGNSRAVNPLSSLTLRSSTLTKHDKDQNSLERCRKAKFNDGDSSNINFNNGGVKIDGMDNDHYINDVSGKLSNNCVLLEQESNRGDDCSVHDSKQCHDHNDVGDTSDSGSAINASPDTASCPAPSNTERTGTMITTDINAAVAIPEDLNDLDAIPSYDTLNAHVSSLYHEGKELFYQGQYDKAYRVQLEALVAISDHHESSKSTTSSLLPNQGDDNIKEEHSDSNIMKTHGTNSSFDRLDAMIRYELANIQYVAIRENTTLFDADPSIEADSKASSECHDNTLALSRLHDQVEDAKCRIAAVNYQYYRRELKVVEQSSDSSDWNQIYNKLFILHNLGKLCDQDFHLYDDALRYYERALSIEESLLDTLKNSKTLPSRSDDAIEKNDSKKCEFDWDVKEFTHRVRMTKKKIGSIYYTSGRFDLALLSSFSS